MLRHFVKRLYLYRSERKMKIGNLWLEIWNPNHCEKRKFLIFSIPESSFWYFEHIRYSPVSCRRSLAYLLKKKKKPLVFYVSRGYKKRPVPWNELRQSKTCQNKQRIMNITNLKSRSALNVFYLDFLWSFDTKILSRYKIMR